MRRPPRPPLLRCCPTAVLNAARPERRRGPGFVSAARTRSTSDGWTSCWTFGGARTSSPSSSAACSSSPTSTPTWNGQDGARAIARGLARVASARCKPPLVGARGKRRSRVDEPFVGARGSPGVRRYWPAPRSPCPCATRTDAVSCSFVRLQGLAATCERDQAARACVRRGRRGNGRDARAGQRRRPQQAAASD